MNSNENPPRPGEDPGAAARPAPRPGTTAPGAPAPAPSRAPRPGAVPRPGPVPGRSTPTPNAVAEHQLPPHPNPDSHVAHVPTVPANDPAKWGRIDADGGVWVRTAGGERRVGEWQAGDAEEGLAHFGRKYQDLATEIELLESRIESGTADLGKTRASAQALLESVPTAAVVGDVDALAGRLETVCAHCDIAVDEARRRKDARRTEQIARKEALADEAERIAAEGTQWKQAGDRLRAILDEWKSIRGIDRKTDDQLWRRYSKAREAFNRRRGSHFAELDRQRVGAKHKKEDLVQRAEALADSTDWGPTAGVFRDLMAEWKQAGRAPREIDDALWARFKSAQDTFFGARKQMNAEIDAEYAENAEAKEQLLVEAERIDPSVDLDAARATLRGIQDRWESLGKVPRDRMHGLEARIRAVETRVHVAADARWRRTDPEALARAAQFRERVEQFEAQAAKADAAGRAGDAEKARAQARQWREWADAAETAVDDR
ncbi:DUF349 domain-containing protein [Tomitella fengzijianii]|uniref:DUF349 domain-containing protein n=1 Tax=Tomitella fengzijianii TaxID=2597660 RepID=A0A516X3J1_9ACTN|nr:DUF349 domain-containing protein [Tomitella fengzijianii]QDQ97636.1 DUF349 domain-containing protein [Tomitella fengzijianii]